MQRRERGRTPAGFRDQLLARLRNYARERDISVQRVQQHVAFERLLARLPESGDWILKGGFALELRYDWDSRPTKDIDLRTSANLRAALIRLRTAIAESAIVDHFSFELAEAGQEMQGAPGGSLRVRVIARLAGISLADFHIDLSSGDAVVGPPDILRGSSLLDFAGIAPIAFPVYPITQQLAEKLHAYTLPRREENTRVKDLVDLIAIVARDTVQSDLLTESVRATFRTRATHALPESLPAPPPGWSDPFSRLIAEVPDMGAMSLQDGHLRAAGFWNPVLADMLQGSIWTPSSRAWAP
jgi:hypothetical protein